MSLKTSLSVLLYLTFYLHTAVGACDIKMYPYYASIRDTSNNLCGGVILNERWVLTAGDCVKAHIEQPDKLVFVAGSNLLNPTDAVQDSPVKYIKMHPDFKKDATGYKNNIALYKLAIKLSKTDTVDFMDIDAAPPSSKKGNLVGFGRAVTEIKIGTGIMEVNHTTEELTCIPIDVTDCKENENQLCVTKTTMKPCEGYNGGPLISNNLLLGIMTSGEKCEPKVKTTFTKTYKYFDWAKKNIQEAKDSGEDKADDQVAQQKKELPPSESASIAHTVFKIYTFLLMLCSVIVLVI